MQNFHTKTCDASNWSPLSSDVLSGIPQGSIFRLILCVVKNTTIFDNFCIQHKSKHIITKQNIQH